MRDVASKIYARFNLLVFLSAQGAGVLAERDFDAVDHERSVERHVEPHQVTITISISGSKPAGGQAPVISVSGAPLNGTSGTNIVLGQTPVVVQQPVDSRRADSEQQVRAERRSPDATPDSNAAKIALNKQHLYELESAISSVTFKSQFIRGIIQESREVLNNDDIAFQGTVQSSNILTDMILADRKAILSALEPGDQVQKNYKDSMINSAKLDFLEHSVEISKQLAGVCDVLAEANSEMITAVQQVLETNEIIQEFNAKRIEKNSQYVAPGYFAPHNSSDKANGRRLDWNEKQIQGLLEKTEQDDEAVGEHLDKLDENRKLFEEIREKLDGTRQELIEHMQLMMKDLPRTDHMLSVPTHSENFTAADSTVEQNVGDIKKNSKAIFKLEDAFKDNIFSLYKWRAETEAAGYMISKNYELAFNGDRQMSSIYTDKIFLHTLAILEAMVVEDQVQHDYKESVINAEKIEFFEHHSKVTRLFADVNVKLAEVNNKRNEANGMIIEASESMMEFHKAQIDLNAKLSEQEGSEMREATAATNAERIKGNADKITAVEQVVSSNHEAIQASGEKSKANQEELEKQVQKINERHKKIEESMAQAMREISEKIAALI